MITRAITGSATIVMLLCASAHAAHLVRFEIDMRAEIAAGRFDPALDQVGVRGGGGTLSWTRTLRAGPLGEGRYAVEATFERTPFGGQALPYKFKIDRPGRDPDEGWEQGRNHLLEFHAQDPTVVARRFGAQSNAPAIRRAGTIERLPPLASAYVSAREVQVWLPPGYARAAPQRYPVLYLHDGQNVFDAAAAGAEWQVDETAQRLVETRAIEPLIIVAVANVPADRVADYTPTAGLLEPDPKARSARQPVGGGAARYAHYLIEELKPMIDQRFRTKPESQYTSVGGSSLGALATIWLLLHHGETFGAGLVVSPAVWWDDDFVLRDLAGTALAPGARPRVWLDIGTREGQDAVLGARRLRDALRARGWTASTLRYEEQTEGSHDEASWASRVEGMLRFLYGGPP